MTPETEVLKVQDTGADLVPLPAPGASPALDRVRAYIRASKAENTLRGYQADWRDFCGGARCTS
jgi:hypothetical protein